MFELAALGMGLQAATDIMTTKDETAWLKMQDRFNLPMKQALGRMKSYY